MDVLIVVSVVGMAGLACAMSEVGVVGKSGTLKRRNDI